MLSSLLLCFLFALTRFRRLLAKCKPSTVQLNRFVPLHICLFLWSMKRVFALLSMSTDLVRFGLAPFNWKL